MQRINVDSHVTDFTCAVMCRSVWFDCFDSCAKSLRTDQWSNINLNLYDKVADCIRNSVLDSVNVSLREKQN